MKRIILLTLILGNVFIMHSAADPDLKVAFDNGDEPFIETLLWSNIGELLKTYNNMTLSDFLNSIHASDAIKQLVANAYLFYIIQNGSVEDMQNVINGSPFVIKEVIYQGLPPANVNAVYQKSNNVTATMIAAVADLDKVNLLISHRANVGPDIRDDSGNTTLHHAASYGRDNVIERLIPFYLDLNQINSKGATALMLAAQYGEPITIERLIALGANRSLTDNNGNNALWYLNNGYNMYVYDLDSNGNVQRDFNGNLILASDPVLAYQELVDLLTPQVI